MTHSLCIADRVPAKDCPCVQCRKVIEMARRMGEAYARSLRELCLKVLTEEVK